MPTILPSLRVQNLGSSLRILYVDNTDLVRDKRNTYLSEDVVEAATTIRVQSLVGFESLTTSSGQIVCIGEVGNEKTELIRTSSTTPFGPTRYEVTLNSGLIFDHPQDTKVYIVDWNRADFQYAGTVTGTKTTITAYPLPLQVDQKETLLRDTSTPGDRVSAANPYYFVRFNDSNDSRSSAWSDGVYSQGYDDNTVFAIKKRALESAHEQVDGDLITHEFLNQTLWEARREYHNAPGKRPFRRKYNTILGSAALTGSFRVELPTDVQSPFSAENIYGVRIGASPNMAYYDKKDWDFDFLNKPHSTLDVPYTRGISTSIWVANGRDFARTGVLSVEGMNITYTKVTGSNNSMTITAHGSYPSASAGSDVWQNVSYGLPDKFTVFADPGGSAYIYFNRPIDTAYINQNIYADYYSALLGYDSDADILDEPQYDMFIHYLAYKIRARKARGQIPVIRTRSGQPVIADADYQMWELKKANALGKEYLGTEIRITPDVEYLDPTRYW